MRPIGIKEQRVKLGLTQAELGKKLGVDQTAVALWERGIGPKRSRLPEVAKALKCTIADLLAEGNQEDTT